MSHEHDKLVKSLQTVAPFAELDDTALRAVAEKAHIIHLTPRRDLHASEVRDALCFLATGEVELYVDDRFIQKIVAHTERAAEPVFRLQTEGLRITSQAVCHLVCVERAAVGEYVEQFGHRGAQDLLPTLSAIELTEQENALLSDIHRRFASNEVTLPSLPDVAVQINQAIQDPSLDMRRVAEILKTDPIIAARLVQVANSAIYGGLPHVSSLREAVVRIGLRGTQALVMSVVLNNLFSPKTANVQRYMHALYDHSIFIGALSQAICRRVKGFDPDHALLAGLVHDIGVVPVLVLIDEDPELGANPVLTEAAIAKLHGFVGGLLLQEWGFANDLIMVAEEADDWMRNDRQEPDYCDVVLVAQLHTGLLRGGQKGRPPIHTVPAFARLGLDRFKPETGVHILDEARHAVSSTVQLLRA